MPKITVFALDCYPNTSDENEVSHELFAFVQSKKTLSSITLWIEFENVFAIVQGIIDILKTQCRPYLSLTLPYHEFNNEEVSRSDTKFRKSVINSIFRFLIFQKIILNDNNHLIGVNLEGWDTFTYSVIYTRNCIDVKLCDRYQRCATYIRRFSKR